MAKKKPNYKKHDWDKYKEEYIFSNCSLPDLVKKYGVSLSQLGKVAKKGNWVELRKQKKEEIAKEVEKTTTESEIERRKKINEAHLELYDEGLELVRSLLDDYKDYQRRVKSGELKKSLSPFNLEKIFICLEKAQRGQRLALGCDSKNSVEESDKEPEVCYIANLDIEKV
jgi:hypothetical protein